MKGRLKLTNGTKLISPSLEGTRPTTSKIREAIINMIGNDIKGSNWLDLFSGSGVMGCEALQKGAKRILSIEYKRSNARISRENLLNISKKISHSTHIQVICNDVTSTLKKGIDQKQITIPNPLIKQDNKFDFIYLDPPYKDNIYNSTLKYLLLGHWVKRHSVLICECATKHKPLIPDEWKVTREKTYGKSCLIFLIPNQAKHYFDDTGSKH